MEEKRLQEVGQGSVIWKVCHTEWFGYSELLRYTEWFGYSELLRYTELFGYTEFFRSTKSVVRDDNVSLCRRVYFTEGFRYMEGKCKVEQVPLYRRQTLM